MFRIEDGRDSFYQWDLNRKLIVDDSTITEVHFCNRTGNCSLVCLTYKELGVLYVNVPNVLLQNDWKIRVYAYVGYTKHEECFEVKARSKPDNYIYTETEIKRYEDFEERIEELEKTEAKLYESVSKTNSKCEELNTRLITVAEDAAVSVSEEKSNSHRKVSLIQRGINIGEFDCAGKQNGTNGQSWYLTDYTNSNISGDYSASLGFNNESIGNGNIVGGIKNDVSCRASIICGEKNNINSGGTGAIIGGFENNITTSSVGKGAILTGESNCFFDGTIKSGVSIIGYNNLISGGNCNEGSYVGGYKNTIQKGLASGMTVIGFKNTSNSNNPTGATITGVENKVGKLAAGALVCGKYAEIDDLDTVFVVGGGGTTSSRKNMLQIRDTGEIIRAGVITIRRDINGNLTATKDGLSCTLQTVADIIKDADKRYSYEIRVEAISTDDESNTYINTTIVKDFVEIKKLNDAKEIRLVAHDNIRIFMIFIHFNGDGVYENTTSTADKIKDLALGGLGNIFG